MVPWDSRQDVENNDELCETDTVDRSVRSEQSRPLCLVVGDKTGVAVQAEQRQRVLALGGDGVGPRQGLIRTSGEALQHQHQRQRYQLTHRHLPGLPRIRERPAAAGSRIASGGPDLR